LVYNFFTGSSLKNKWRVIYEYIEKNEPSLHKDRMIEESYSKFDIHKHYLLCSELKHLYVAVTRARQRLWFYEEDEEICQPMLDYWVHSGLIETKFMDESFISTMTSRSTPEEWRKSGVKVYQPNFCF
jgi:superfamily I DNA/RNA helicase